MIQYFVSRPAVRGAWLPNLGQSILDASGTS